MTNPGYVYRKGTFVVLATVEPRPNRAAPQDEAFLALSLEAVCFFRLLLSFDNASSFLAAHA